MAADGIRNALAFVTSAYSSYSGCRQYLEDIDRARVQVGVCAPRIEKLRAYWNHPGFIEPMADNLRTALSSIAADERSATRVVFTAHSLPESMASSCDYAAQLDDAATLVAHECGLKSWDRVYQSRSGQPTQPWLEPDIVDHIEALAARGIGSVIVVPLGFISDHMEVVYDLDTQARARPEELGMAFVRVPTVGTAPRFVSMIRELIEERITRGAPVRALGGLGPRPADCAAECCPTPLRPSHSQDAEG
jgi:ferrochelatase